MKKVYITIVLLFFTGLLVKAQYTGGDGSGIISGDLSGKHLTNWFQINGYWSTNGNWSDGVTPTAFEEANILAEATLDGDYTYPVVYIAPGAVLNITEGNTLTVSESVENNSGNAGLILQNGSSLIHNNDNVPGTMLLTLADADWTNGLDGWHLVSSPVENQLLVNGEFLSDPYDFYAWRETSNSWLNQKVGSSNITSFIPGIGYLVSYDNGGTKTFAGTLNVSSVSFSNLSKTGSSYYIGYHLLGNPFASALKWNDGNWALSNIGGVASVWNETAQNYTSLSNPNDIIPANQGFFVQVSDASNNITIPSSARMHNSTPFYKQTPANFLKLRITNSENETFDETIVRFIDDATINYDPDYDGHKMSGSEIAPQLYTIITPGENAAVNSYSPADVPADIVLDFKPGLAATYTLMADEFTFDRQIILEDRKNGNTLLLNAGTTYTFNGVPGDNLSRFILHFSPLGIADPEQDQEIKVYSCGNIIYLNSPGKVNGSVRIVSTAGQLVYLSRLGFQNLKSIDAQNFAPGVYFVNVVIDNKTFNQKVLIR
ncbi:MAG: T9SS type A sorting domain-containing protein [Bacteroidota bacterium]